MSNKRWYGLYFLKTFPPFMLCLELMFNGVDALIGRNHVVFYGIVSNINQLSVPARMTLGAIITIIGFVGFWAVNLWRAHLRLQRLRYG